MTALPPPLILLASAGLAVVFAAAVYALIAGSPSDVATPAVLPVACSSCDARHARLQVLQDDIQKGQE